MKNFKTLLLLIASLALTVSLHAQTKVMAKSVMQTFKTLNEGQQEALLKYANLGLSGKEGDVKIEDKKTLKKYFKLLPPKHQEQVVKYAERQLATGDLPKTKPMANAPTPPSMPATPPKSTDLVKNGQVVQGKSAVSAPMVKPAAPATPPQPAWMVKAESMTTTEVEWYETTHDFGEITEGDIVTHTFRFKNVGDAPLLLTRVKPSCGCTSPEWSREEVAPGAEGMVTVSFNSSHKRGNQHKSVVITHNGDPVNKVLTFKATVNAKPAVPATPATDGN